MSPCANADFLNLELQERNEITEQSGWSYNYKKTLQNKTLMLEMPDPSLLFPAHHLKEKYQTKNMQ